MKYYSDIIQEKDPQPTENYSYIRWNDTTISTHWHMSNANPIINSQYYPQTYWEDILHWLLQKRSNAISNKVLDIGCGGGNMIASLEKIISPTCIIGIDLTDAALSYVRNRFEHKSNIKFKCGTIDHLPVDSNSIDLVTCTEVLEHLPLSVFHQGITEVKRVLKPGGLFVATLPIDEKMALVHCPQCHSVFTPYQHMIFEISKEDIQKVLKDNGFKVVDFYHPIDRSQPKTLFRRIIKSLIIRLMPRIALMMFPKPGTNGFLAIKVDYA